MTRRSMSPASIHYYNDWSSLNYMYGVVNISYHEDAKVSSLHFFYFCFLFLTSPF